MYHTVEFFDRLPGNTGFSITLANPLANGLVHAMSRIQAYHYRELIPKIRFAMKHSNDEPSRLDFTYNGTDHELALNELLLLLKELNIEIPTEYLTTGHQPTVSDHQIGV